MHFGGRCSLVISDDSRRRGDKVELSSLSSQLLQLPGLTCLVSGGPSGTVTGRETKTPGKAMLGDLGKPSIALIPFSYKILVLPSDVHKKEIAACRKTLVLVGQGPSLLGQANEP